MAASELPIVSLAVSGSLRRASSNMVLLEAAGALAPAGMGFRIYSSLGELPHFNPDLEPHQFSAVRGWISKVREAHGFIVSSPEYAHGVPGSLKNGLDWLVGSDAFVNKPFMLLNASARSTFARDSLIEILTTMSGLHVEKASLTVPLLGSDPDRYAELIHQKYAGEIRASLELFARSVRDQLSRNDQGR